MKEFTILKIGGNILDNPASLESLLDYFSRMPGHRALVHGGGKIASVLMKRMGIEPLMVEGRRVTDPATLDIVVMVYAGLINKSIVSALQSRGCDALGLSGADAGAVPAHKRPAGTVDYGLVGDVDTDLIPADRIARFVDEGLVPVFAPITHDRTGQLLNTNADTMASSVAIAMSRKYQTTLVYCFEKPGVLMNATDESSVIASLNEPQFLQYKAEGIITAGMIPKLENAFDALRKGVSAVRICGPEAFLKTGGHPGTLITLNTLAS
jgi:acetylglutamate kinase